MAGVLNQEPQAFGYIKFKTTFGDLDIELFTKQCPKICKNFTQLCLDGYYKDTIFDRVEKDFIAIGGIRSSGDDDDEDDEEYFPDEFHSRLRFTRRGLLATANARKDQNGPKFFFTLGPTPELQNKHTIFGRLKGNTVYSLVDLNECQTDEEFCPLSEQKVLDVDVIDNPLPDLKVRVYKQLLYANQVGKSDDDDQDEDPLAGPKTDLTHTNKRLLYPEDDDDDESDEEDVKETVNEPINTQAKLSEESCESAEASKQDPIQDLTDPGSRNSPREVGSEPEDKEDKLLRLRAKFEAVRQQLASKTETPIEQHEIPPSSKDTEGGSSIKSVPRKDKRRERETLERVENFKKKLKLASMSERKNDESKHMIPEGDSESINLDLLDDDDWLNHKFTVDDTNEVKMAKDASTKDSSWYAVDDPRRSRDKSSHKHHSRHHDRDRHSRRHREHDSSRSNHRRR